MHPDPHPAQRTAPTPRPLQGQTLRQFGAGLLLALLFVPLFLATIGTLHAPEPWRASGPEWWGVVVTWLMAWVVLPLIVGTWIPRWWWPPLCAAAVAVTSLCWNSGVAHFVPGQYHLDLAPVPVQLLSPAIALGGLAALMASTGVLLARRSTWVDRALRRGLTRVSLVVATVPLGVASTVVLLVNPARPEAPGLARASEVIVLSAWAVGPLAAGVWLRWWRWPLVCVLGLVAAVLFWAVPYSLGGDLSSLEGKRFSSASWAEVAVIIVGAGGALLAGASAIVGTFFGRRRGRDRYFAAE